MSHRTKLLKSFSIEDLEKEIELRKLPKIPNRRSLDPKDMNTDELNLVLNSLDEVLDEVDDFFEYMSDENYHTDDDDNFENSILETLYKNFYGDNIFERYINPIRKDK